MVASFMFGSFGFPAWLQHDSNMLQRCWVFYWCIRVHVRVLLQILRTPFRRSLIKTDGSESISVGKILKRMCLERDSKALEQSAAPNKPHKILKRPIGWTVGHGRKPCNRGRRNITILLRNQKLNLSSTVNRCSVFGPDII